jgi:hypothetical protein
MAPECSRAGGFLRFGQVVFIQNVNGLVVTKYDEGHAIEHFIDGFFFSQSRKRIYFDMIIDMNIKYPLQRRKSVIRFFR